MWVIKRRADGKYYTGSFRSPDSSFSSDPDKALTFYPWQCVGMRTDCEWEEVFDIYNLPHTD